MNPVRRMAYRFMALPHQRRLEVARRLELVNENDDRLSDRERYEAYFLRARDRNILAQLGDVIESVHSGHFKMDSMDMRRMDIDPGWFGKIEE